MSESGGEGGKCVVDPNTTTKAIVSASIASSSSPDDVHNKMLIETTTSTATAAVVVAAATTTTTKDINVHQKDNNSVGGVKKLRRAFSLSARNPFRLSKRNKNASDQQQPAEDLMPSSKQSETSNQHQQQQHPPSVACHITTDGKKPKEELRLFRRSSIRKFISRIAQQMTSVSIRPKPSTNTATGDRVPPLGASWPPPDQTPGVTGLKNHGNTCFMNAVLQCLSHTDILAEYFVLDQYKADLKRRNKINSRKFGTKGELTEQLALVLKALWMCCNEAEYSTQFKAVVDRYGAQFRSSTQHDAQEFLFWLLDKVHEDLNTASKRKYKSVKNSYGRPDEVIAAETLANHIRCNNSFVQAVFQAQFRSSLTCPRCHKQSNTFDPFHCISVQLPQLAQQAVFVTVLYASQHPKQVKLGLGVAPGACVGTLRDQLQADTRIPIDRIILTEISSQGFGRVFCDSYPVSELELLDTDTTIFCIETTATQGNQQQQSTAKDAKTPESQTNNSLTLICTNLLVPNADAKKQRFGTPFCLQVDRDVSFNELQKRLLKELAPVLRTDVFTYATAPSDMFRIRLQDPSADEDSYMESTVEHPLFTEMIELALSILPPDAGPSHVKLALEWKDADAFFQDTTDPSVEHASVQQMREKCPSSAILSLEQCLEHYTRAETLSTEDAWRCPHCQQYLPVVKTLGLWSLPDILVIHFKRFRQHGDKGSTAAKLTTMVDFPLNGFDMTPHLAKKDEINGSPWKSKGTSSHSNKKGSLTSAPVDNRYDLYAVCYHQGDTLETGHYTAACKNPYDHQWYKFDDQRVSLVSHEAEDGQIVNNEAYILFYQRRKVDLNGGECSGTSSTSSQDHWVSRLAPLAVQQTSTSNSQSSIRPIITAPVIKDEDAIITEEIPTETTKEEVAVSSVPAATSITSPESGISLIPENIHDESNKIEVKAEINNSSSTPTVAFPIVEVASTPTASTVSTNMQRIEKTREDEIVDVESLDFAIENAVETSDPIPSIDAEEELVDDEVDGKILSSEIKAMSTKVDLICKKQHEREKADNLIATLSSSMPTQFPSNSLSSSFFFNGAVGNFASNRSSLNFSNSCSKDTLLYIDHHRHHELEELEDHHRHHHGSDAFLGNRSLWISPVTPHKLITVSPKN